MGEGERERERAETHQAGTPTPHEMVLVVKYLVISAHILLCF